MNLVQQLAEYQNAPIQSLEMAKKGANPAISPWVAAAILSDRIEKQKRMGMEQGAAMGQQPTVDEQQDQELAGIMGLPGAPQAAAQAQPAPQEPVMAAEGGLMQARVNPGMYDYCGGGIIAFEEGGDVEDAVYDPVTGALISGGETRRGENQTVREALGLGNKENRLALERAEEERRQAGAPKPRPASNLSAGEKDKQSAYARLIKEGVPPELAAQLSGMSPAAAPAAAPKAPPAGAKPAPSAGAGAAKDSGIVAQLTGSPEWADLDAARKRMFEAPKLPTTAGEQAAERAAHLKAQGITDMPWDTAAKQTAELRRLMGDEDAARAAKREASQGREKFGRIVANMGAGSFGASGAQGLRAQIKHDDEMAAEDQRIKELRFNQKLKLNEIDAKAQELRYNEATGDVAAAQKNRKEIAEMQRAFEKDKVAIAQGMAGLRERGLASQLSADTQLKAANMRASQAGSAETKAAISALKAQKDSINARFAKDMIYKRTPQGKADAAELLRIEAKLAELGGLEGGPVQSQMSPPPPGAVRLKK